MKINGVDWVWDYAREAPVLKSEMTNEQLAGSEKAKWIQIKDSQQCKTKQQSN
jgi:hypothetical protein